jgi:hypothetical protein
MLAPNAAMSERRFKNSRVTALIAEDIQQPLIKRFQFSLIVALK